MIPKLNGYSTNYQKPINFGEGFGAPGSIDTNLLLRKAYQSVSNTKDGEKDSNLKKWAKRIIIFVGAVATTKVALSAYKGMFLNDATIGLVKKFVEGSDKLKEGIADKISAKTGLSIFDKAKKLVVVDPLSKLRENLTSIKRQDFIKKAVETAKEKLDDGLAEEEIAKQIDKATAAAVKAANKVSISVEDFAKELSNKAFKKVSTVIGACVGVYAANQAKNSNNADELADKYLSGNSEN